jgi:hypothetical protein
MVLDLHGSEGGGPEGPALGTSSRSWRSRLGSCPRVFASSRRANAHPLAATFERLHAIRAAGEAGPRGAQGSSPTSPRTSPTDSRHAVLVALSWCHRPADRRVLHDHRGREEPGRATTSRTRSPPCASGWWSCWSGWSWRPAPVAGLSPPPASRRRSAGTASIWRRDRRRHHAHTAGLIGALSSSAPGPG